MKTLIVHDRAEVAGEIKKVVTDNSEPADRCDVAGDYKQARERLAAEVYDLLIVDLTIPIAENIGAPGFEAVHALLDELFGADTLNVPGDVIGITRDPNALALVENKLGPHLMVAIAEDSEGKWKGYLQDKLAYSRRAARTRSVAASQHHDYDALIVTAMDVEMEPYLRAFEMRPSRLFRSAREFMFMDRSGSIRRGVAYSIGRSGQPSAASLAQALITFFRPRIALMSGYCGGVKDKVALGDLVFFEAAYAWDYGKWEEDIGPPPQAIFRARPDPISIIDHPLHEAARRYLQSQFSSAEDLRKTVSEASAGQVTDFKLHLKPAASGSAVVAADDIVARIRGLNDSVWAVDMEAYGFYHAANFTRVVRPHFMCVKSVSDYSNGEKGDNLHRACSFLSAEVVIRLLTRDWVFKDATCEIAA